MIHSASSLNRRGDFDPRKLDYPETMQPDELFGGPEGGGIVTWYGDPSNGR
jgi:hypothetical protein